MRNFKRLPCKPRLWLAYSYQWLADWVVNFSSATLTPCKRQKQGITLAQTAARGACMMGTMMLTHETHWHGRPLSDYTKEELIGIIEKLGHMLFSEQRQANHELNVLRGLPTKAMEAPWLSAPPPVYVDDHKATATPSPPRRSARAAHHAG